jgi:UDP-N-acetylglucosamine 2-epimerase
VIKRKICIVTGRRAEYGFLYWLMKEIQKDKDLEFQLIGLNEKTGV